MISSWYFHGARRSSCAPCEGWNNTERWIIAQPGSARMSRAKAAAIGFFMDLKPHGAERAVPQ
jgi:hypothetical protein